MLAHHHGLLVMRAVGGRGLTTGHVGAPGRWLPAGTFGALGPDAAAELGTTTKVATVNEALRLVAARRRMAAYLDLLAELDLADDRDRAWRAA